MIFLRKWAILSFKVLIFRGVFGTVTPGVIEYVSMLNFMGVFCAKSQHKSLICEICTIKCF